MKAHKHGNETPFYPLCWPHLHQKKKKITLVCEDIPTQSIPKFQSWAKYKRCRSYALCCTHYKILALHHRKLGPFTVSNKCRWGWPGHSKLHAQPATCEWEQWSGSREQEGLPILHPPTTTRWEGLGQGARGRKASGLHENGSSLPRHTHWPQWMLNRGLVASTK